MCNMPRWHTTLLRNKHSKDMRYDEIGLYAQHILTI